VNAEPELQQVVEEAAAGNVNVTLTKSDNVTEEQKEQAREWAVWDSITHPQEPEGSGKFPFDYSANHQERVLIISGEATLTPDDGSAPVVIQGGDFVVFHRGFACEWHVTSPMKKHYAYFDEEGKEAQPNNISCDLCGEQCWEDSYLMDGETDLCPLCFETKGSNYKAAERCVHGDTVETVQIPKAKRARKATKKKK